MLTEKEHERTFEGFENVPYLDLGGTLWVYTHVKHSLSCILQNCAL